MDPGALGEAMGGFREAICLEHLIQVIHSLLHLLFCFTLVLYTVDEGLRD